MIDVSKYSHIRFKEDFNCSSFVKLVLKDNGLNYPVDFVDHSDSTKVAESIANKKPLFYKVEKPEDFDLIYIKESDGRRHLGLYIKYNRILHLRREGSPVLQKITKEIQSGIIGFYRLKPELNNA